MEGSDRYCAHLPPKHDVSRLLLSLNPSAGPCLPMGHVIGVQEVEHLGNIAQNVAALTVPPQPHVIVLAIGFKQISACERCPNSDSLGGK